MDTFESCEDSEHRTALICTESGARICVSCTYDADLNRHRFGIAYYSRKDANCQLNHELALRIDQILRANGAVDFDPSG